MSVPQLNLELPPIGQNPTAGSAEAHNDNKTTAEPNSDPNSDPNTSPSPNIPSDAPLVHHSPMDLDQQQSSSRGDENAIFPDLMVGTINIKTNRSASHLFYKQKLETIRKINQANLPPEVAPFSPTFSNLSSPNKSSGALFRQQHSLNRSMSQFVEGNNAGQSLLPGGLGGSQSFSHIDPEGVGSATVRQEEFNFEYKDHGIKPMTQAEFDDIRKKKESSLDFTQSVNNIYMIDQFATTRQRRLCNGIFAWVAVVVIAILTGAIGAALRIANTRVNNYKFQYSGNYLIEQNYIAAWGVFASWNLLMLMCSTFLVLCFEIKANGSGIPDVKAYLNGCNVSGAFTTRTLLTKLVSSALTINAGVPSGLQGPVIHLGSITGAWIATWWKAIVTRLFCCARPHEELRNFKDIPRLPNPVSAKTYKQGYFQAVHEEQLGLLNNRHQEIRDYTENDLFLQSAGVKLDQITATSNNYRIDTKNCIHNVSYPARTDINTPNKPQLKLGGGDETISPRLIDNLTIDDDLVPTSNTGRRKLAQCGVSIEAKKTPFDDELATDFAKAVKNPTKFGSHVNANGGVFGFVIRDKQIRVQVVQTPPREESWVDVGAPADVEDRPSTSPQFIEDLGHGRATTHQNNGNDDYEHPDDDFQPNDPVSPTNAVNVYDLDEEQRSVATRCPRWWRAIQVPSFADDSARREFVSIGSGAGVAAAMGSIIGGVLFALEEMSTHWSPTLGLKVLAGSTIACIVAAFFASGNNGIWGIFASTTNTYYIGNRVAPYRIEEIPLYVLLGIICGLLGALYIFITMNIMRWRNAVMGPRIIPKFIDTAILCLIWSTLCFVIPFAWPCETISPDYAAAQAISNASAGTFGTNRFDCPVGFHNKFADLSFVRSDLTVKRLFARDLPGSFELPELAAWSLLYFLFCAIIQQTNASFGIIVPIFVMGCSFGRFFGKLFYDWWGYAQIVGTGTTPVVYFDPGIYAVVGAAAMFSAITRSTLSMTVVVLEMTADLNLLAPSLIAAFIANIVASQFGPSVFVSIIQERKLPFLSPDPPAELYRMTTKQIMIPKPIILGSCERVDHLLAILESSTHAGYPVVLEPCTAVNVSGIDSRAHRGEGCDNNFIGMILRSHILIILNRRVWRATSTPFTFQDYQRVLSRAMPKLGELRARLTSADLLAYIDLTSWVNRSSLIVPEHMLAAQTFSLFRSMGLRHIPVINSQKHISGVVTRLELLERVVQHRWITLRKLERDYIDAGGSSLAQQYVDANTAYSLVSAHAINRDVLARSRQGKSDAYLALHGIPTRRSADSSGSNNNNSNNSNNTPGNDGFGGDIGPKITMPQPRPSSALKNKQNDVGKENKPVLDLDKLPSLTEQNISPASFQTDDLARSG